MSVSGVHLHSSQVLQSCIALYKSYIKTLDYFCHTKYGTEILIPPNSSCKYCEVVCSHLYE